mgnify:CR=1 FL=1
MKTRKVPMRRCAGCMKSKPKKELIRIVGDKEGHIFLDTTGKANGRGVYLCPEKECLEKARKKNAVSRSLGMRVSQEDLDRVFAELDKYEKENA